MLPLDALPTWQPARRERIALGTLYRYFSSKEHLYAAVLQEWAAFGPRARGGAPSASGAGCTR